MRWLDHMRTELVIGAPDMAARNYRLVENGILFRSWHANTSEEFARHTTRHGIQWSTEQASVTIARSRNSLISF